MNAVLTLNTGRSLLIGTAKLLRDKPYTTTDPELIRRCQETAGVAVQIVKPKKLVRKVEKVEASDKPKRRKKAEAAE